MKRLVFFSLVLAALALTVCAMGRREPKTPPKSFAVEQGVAGKVEVWEGNFMPMIGGHPSGKITPASDRRVRVHESFNSREFGKFDALQDTIPTPMVAETRTDSAGQYRLSLPVGTYSIFVEENGKWYFNGWDGDGFQGLFHVDSSRVTTQDIHIMTKAVF